MFDDNYRELSIEELLNANTDRSVNPAVLVFGQAVRTSAGNWVYPGSDASNFRVSSLGGTLSLSADASGNRVSALQLDAGNLHMSAFSNDAGLFRMSSIGGSLSLSADASGNRVSAIQQDATNLRVSSGQFPAPAALTDLNANPTTSIVGAALLGWDTVNSDWNRLRTSLLSADGQPSHTVAVLDVVANTYGYNGVTSSWDRIRGGISGLNVSQPDAGNLLISAKVGDASQFRVSSIVDSGSISAKQGDAGNLHVSAFVDSGSISAKSADANQFHISSIQGDANLQHVSSVQGDANLQHVSSYFGVDTTGQWTIGRLSNLSSSGNIKATAGTLYGYYAYNTTTIPAYINFTNTSGAINVGTDSVLFKVMLPASAAANVGFPGGLKGFTAGIGVYATSAISDAATTPVATSAVGINVFYN